MLLSGMKATWYVSAVAVCYVCPARSINYIRSEHMRKRRTIRNANGHGLTHFMVPCANLHSICMHCSQYKPKKCVFLYNGNAFARRKLNRINHSFTMKKTRKKKIWFVSVKIFPRLYKFYVESFSNSAISSTKIETKIGMFESWRKKNQKSHGKKEQSIMYARARKSTEENCSTTQIVKCLWIESNCRRM